MSLRITYLINQYPKVSHSFIRREILALERQGCQVQRIAVRGWDETLVDAEDQVEQTRTQYVLQGGVPALLLAVVKLMLTAPVRFFSALVLAIKMSRRADRPLPFHLIYLAEACRILPWLKAFQASHVHAHFGTNSAEVAMLVHSLGGPPYSFTVHGPEEFDKPEFIGLREKMRRSAFVVAISAFGRSQLYRWLDGADWPKVAVVHCGLEPAFFDVEGVAASAPQRLVCVGRLCEQKGQLLLIEAAHRLAGKGIDFELVLAGDGEMRAAIEARIAQHGLEQRVRITGWISGAQVRAELLAARALVLPSFAEGLPVVIMEALALRRPVLTTYVAGIPELVQDGENGWLFPAGSIDALSQAMEQCLLTPAPILQRMGDAGYARVLQRHAIDTEAAKLVALFGQSQASAMQHLDAVALSTAQ